MLIAVGHQRTRLLRRAEASRPTSPPGNRLLHASKAPVHTIAQQVGYSSQYTFTHACKRQYGSPPSNYRHHCG
ncbi:helix-turn-helix domain-containing protein [Streptomyces sp. NPDC006992]|uniref:helix-turn-helix domain-containing protein n=1 Tax=unclassified Streptomyces TaxID=2593676 RepID=UPI0034043EAF